MKDLTSLPASVRYRQLAQQQAAHPPAPASFPAPGNPGAQLAQSVEVLAKTNPELFGAIVASMFGHNQMTLTQVNERTVTTTKEHNLLGYRYAHSDVTETVRTTTTKTIRFGSGR